MSRKLQQIALRRAELVLQAQRGRESLAANRVWGSFPVFIVELVLVSWRVMSFGSSIRFKAVGILQAVFPKITLRLANMGLKILMNVNRKWRGLLE